MTTTIKINEDVRIGNTSATLDVFINENGCICVSVFDGKPDNHVACEDLITDIKAQCCVCGSTNIRDDKCPDCIYQD